MAESKGAVNEKTGSPIGVHCRTNLTISSDQARRMEKAASDKLRPHASKVGDTSQGINHSKYSDVSRFKRYEPCRIASNLTLANSVGEIASYFFGIWYDLSEFHISLCVFHKIHRRRTRCQVKCLSSCPCPGRRTVYEYQQPEFVLSTRWKRVGRRWERPQGLT